MEKIRIGVCDEEQQYAISLMDYLQRYGGGKWDVSAFSGEKMLDDYLQENSLDILVGTDKKGLIKCRESTQVIPLWLKNEKEALQEEDNGLYSIYRFQNAENIGRYIEGIVRQEKRELSMEKPMIAIYSPVGRCGKTTLALDVVESGVYGKWIYIGLEDYGSFEEENTRQPIITDEFLYFWKEKREEQLLLLLEQTKGIVVTGSSFIDTKLIQRDDLQWFRNVLQKSNYRGVVLDIGTGILKDLQMLKECNGILVPCIEEKVAQVKRQKFEKLLDMQGFKSHKKKIYFLNMDKKEEKIQILQKLFGGEG